MRWIAMLALVVGCSEAHAVAPKVEAHEAPAKKVEAPAQNVEPPLRLPLGERLAREAKARPVRAVRPAQLVAALAQHGVKVTRQQQVLASPVDALYCELISAPELAISLCEYSDDAAAERGRARSKETFDALIPGRALDTRFNSLLTVTQPAGSERELVRKTFAELEPS